LRLYTCFENLLISSFKSIIDSFADTIFLSFEILTLYEFLVHVWNRGEFDKITVSVCVFIVALERSFC